MPETQNPKWDSIERHYVAFVTQSSTSAPSATVIHNTLPGIPVWARSTTGSYTLTLPAGFPSGRTSFALVNADVNAVGIDYTSESVITVTTGDDGVLDACIHVTVWN